MGWMFVSPCKFKYWNPTPQCSGIRWAFGDLCLCKRNPRELSCPVSAMWGYSENMATWKGAFTRTWPWGYTDLGLLAFRIVRNTFWLFISHPVYSSLLQQLQQTDTEVKQKGSSKDEIIPASPTLLGHTVWEAWFGLLLLGGAAIWCRPVGISWLRKALESIFSYVLVQPQRAYTMWTKMQKIILV